MPVPPWRSRRCSSASQASYSGPPGKTTRCPNGPFADYRENGGVFMSLRLAAAVHPDMRRIRDRVPGATVGVVEHGNAAVLVTVAPGGALVDRREIELTERRLPTHPHHHEGSWAVGRYLNTPGARRLSLADAVALVERVRESAARGAKVGLEALAVAVPVPIVRIAIRACPPLPPTTEERIADHRAQTFADSVMYRQALAAAAEARGWSIHWYDRDQVVGDAATALGCENVDAFLSGMGRAIGPPWQAKHKLAAAAALAASVQRSSRPGGAAGEGNGT